MKAYRLTYLYRTHSKNDYGFVTNNYKIAYNEAIIRMQGDKSIMNTVIYSNRGTCITIARKHADKFLNNGTNTTNNTPKLESISTTSI